MPPKTADKGKGGKGKQKGPEGPTIVQYCDVLKGEKVVVSVRFIKIKVYVKLPASSFAQGSTRPLRIGLQQASLAASMLAIRAT